MDFILNKQLSVNLTKYHNTNERLYIDQKICRTLIGNVEFQYKLIQIPQFRSKYTVSTRMLQGGNMKSRIFKYFYGFPGHKNK